MNQVLSQDEINALLNGLSDEEAGADAGGGDGGGGDGGGEGGGGGSSSKDSRGYDLASQERIIRGRMPTMELIHDRFARSLRTAMSKFLSKTCFITVGSIDIVKFGVFMKKLPLPSSLHIYRMPPLQGYALLVLSTPLVFSIIDSLFGGKGRSSAKIEGREYTQIETRLIAKVTMMALEILKEAWAPVHPLDFVYVRSEFNPLAIGIVPPSDVVIIVTIEIEFESDSTTLSICTPYSTIEPIRQKLTTGLQSTRLEVNRASITRMEQNIKTTDLNLSVNLANGLVTPRQLSTIKPGDVLPLATSADEEATVLVEGVPKFKGYIGTSKGSKAVQLTRTIKKVIE